MNGDRKTMSMVLHGESGTGKSWLGDTVPAPRLILDVEGRAHHTPSQPKVYWDPRTQAPPAAPTAEAPWETCVVDVFDFNLLSVVYQWLRSGEHPFKSVVVDSLMEAQKRWMDGNVGPQSPLKTQDWGAVLRALESFVRDLRDLLKVPAAHVDVAVIICGSITDDTGRARPLLQGQLKNTLPYFVDVVGYLSMMQVGDQLQRVLQLGPTQYAVAKEGTGKLLEDPNVPWVYNPNLQQLYERL